jgi:hypothetical protein
MKNKEEIKQLAEDQCHTMESRLGFAWGYKQCQEDMAKDQTVTRFEVIDENGRAYTEHYCNVELSYQDDGRTLKVFVKSLNKQD